MRKQKFESEVDSKWLQQEESNLVSVGLVRETFDFRVDFVILKRELRNLQFTEKTLEFDHNITNKHRFE